MVLGKYCKIYEGKDV